MKEHMVTIINECLNSSGSSPMCRYDTFLSWITTIEGVTSEETLWFVLVGTWDDKIMINKMVIKIKSMFGIDFSNCQNRFHRNISQLNIASNAKILLMIA